MKEKIEYIKLGGGEPTGEFCWVLTKSGELYYLWWEDAWPDEMTAVHHVRHTQWLSMLRDAVASDLDVEFITEDEDSSKVLTIKLYGRE